MVRMQPSTDTAGIRTRAAARAQQRRRRSIILLSITGALVVALVVVLSVVFIRGAAGESGQPQEPAVAGDCLPASLDITADPVVAGALEAIVADMAGDRSDCPETTITTEDSAVTAAALAQGTALEFDVWVPDSSMWPARVSSQREPAGADAPELIVSDPIATTPVVFAATDPTARALGAEAGFASLAQGAVAAVLPDPSSASASAAALLALQTAVGGDARAFTGLVLGLDARAVVPTTGAALAAASAAASPTVAITTEQALYADSDAAPLVPIYPVDVKPTVTVSLVTVADAAGDTLEAVDALTAAVADASDLLAEHGLRAASGAPLTDGGGAPSVATEPTDGANQAEALRTWEVLTAPSRMLALNDVSGSMSQPATGDMSRIDLFEQAAVRAIDSMSDESSLAIWVFSSRRSGGQDWEEIVPFGSLGAPAHKQLTIDTANSLDRFVGGGTGLYDSVLAAVKYMRETYVPGQVNLVLLNTDGYNEEDDGLDLPGLLAELEKLRDPSKPVAVIAIGYGPDTDQAALEQIAAATDGAAYQALQPTDIGSVLVDATTQRGCRPNCG